MLNMRPGESAILPQDISLKRASTLVNGARYHTGGLGKYAIRSTSGGVRVWRLEDRHPSEIKNSKFFKKLSGATGRQTLSTQGYEQAPRRFEPAR
jgi:hypothetical protein